MPNPFVHLIDFTQPSTLRVAPAPSLLASEWELVGWGVLPEFDLITVALMHREERDEVILQAFYGGVGGDEVYFIEAEGTDKGLQFRMSEVKE